MKTHFFLGLLASLLFFNVASASWVRVINAAANSNPMDVWVMSGQNSTQTAGRLFETLEYGQIPPYFFLANSMEQWTFVFNAQRSISSPDELPMSQVQTLPTFRASLLADETYTLVVVNRENQTGQFDYLLLHDSAPEAQGTHVRLVNLLRGTAFLSMSGQCNQTQSSIEYLTAGEYTALASSSFENLTVCVNGEALQVYPVSAFHKGAKIYSIFVLALNTRTQIEIESGYQAQVIPLLMEPRAGCPGEETVLAREFLGSAFIRDVPTQGAATPLIVDDEPVESRNVFLRAIHASPALPPVDVYLDGQLWFSSVSYANTTLYRPTIRGMHNITIVLSSSLTSEQMQSLNLSVQLPYSFMFFLAWDSYYTLAVLPTAPYFQPRNSIGQNLIGPLHALFIDSICQSNIESDSAYVQVYNLAVKTGAVNFNIGGQSFSLNPLDDFPYRAVPAGSASSITLSRAQQAQIPVIRAIQNLQPNTLYTLFILDQQEQGSAAGVFVRDREVRAACGFITVGIFGN